MDAFILAGGLGTRLKSVVSDRPKPLAEIQGQPFLDILLRQLASLPLIKRVVLGIGYKADLISSYYEKHSYPFDIVCVKEDEPLGTGGALKAALPALFSQEVLVLNGDSYIEFSWDHLHSTFLSKHADIALVARHVDEASRYGKLLIDEEGRIRAFEEKKGSSGMINGGLYLIKRSLIEDLSLTGSFSLEKEVFPLWTHKRFFACPAKGIFIDIGTPESFAYAQTLLRDKL